MAEVLEGNLFGNGSATDGHVLLAPMEPNVIPLPHQIHALSRAISGDRVRYLLADEVGLGKTIEAGLVMRELKLLGLVRRILVVSPKGIATQWVAEMQTHFNEQFQLVLGDDIGTLQRLSPFHSSELRVSGSGFSTQNQEPGTGEALCVIEVETPSRETRITIAPSWRSAPPFGTRFFSVMSPRDNGSMVMAQGLCWTSKTSGRRSEQSGCPASQMHTTLAA